MSTRNNNQSAVKELARAYYKENKSRNRILTFAAAMSVFLLYAAFSIAYGKLRSDYLIDIRGMGTTAAVSLENGSKKQYEQMRDLPYIVDTGIKKGVGSAVFREYWEGRLVYLDKDAYKKIMMPAYTDIVGRYPQNADEIMLSASSLRQMQLEHLKIGMEIELRTILSDGSEGTAVFLLSGYYTDYIDYSVLEPEAYVSKAFLEQQRISVFPADKIMAVTRSLQDERDIETKLYSDLTMEYDAQQVFAENPMVKQSVEGVFGSISIAVGCGIVVILCAFMLIFNVVSITMGKEIRQYGLLKVLGATEQQLKGIVYDQNIRNILKGIMIGAIGGSIAVKIFLPSVLQKLFMQGLGESDVAGFYPMLLAGAGLLIFAAAFFAAGLALRQVVKWNAIDSICYIETGNHCRKKQNLADRFLIVGMAWRGMTRSKKRLLISMGSLLIGCMTALGAAVIMTGTDITNRIEQNPDFRVGILTGIFRFPEMVPDQINDETPVLSADMKNTICEMHGVDKKTIKTAEGSYAVIDFSKNKALFPRKQSLENTDTGIAFATLQIVDESFVNELEHYVVSNDLAVDLERFAAGNSCILLHHNELSRELEVQAEKALGEPIVFYSLNAYGDPKYDTADYEKGSLACAGYLDMTEKYFPKLQTTSLGNDINYFIMTEKAFAKLGFPKKVFDISFDLEEVEDDAVMNQKLSQLVQKENQKSGVMDTFYLEANHILLDSEKNRTDTANVILGGLSLILLVIGIMNYGNMLSAALSVRRKEIAVLQSLGLTRGQLWRMVLYEGIGYWVLLMSSTFIIGSPVIWLLGKAIKRKLLYFKFVYPWQTLLILCIALLGICFAFSGISYFKNRNFIDELRRSDD
ncbi:MAG: FtsX-like permease family protein [Lachnospiraceae bacterium]|nr:FtsX-like permease family protein [Lachnospiraceae bacterium]